jgi:methionyl-tRNA formyltransferase
MGNDDFSINLFHGFKDAGLICDAIITKPSKYLPVGNDGLSKFAKKQKIKYFEIRDLNTSTSIKLISKLNFDVILSAWPDLISKKIIQLSKLGIIGTHPSPLPFGRGRHPLHWLIFNNAKELSLTFFEMNSLIDKGNIILQSKIKIAPDSKINKIKIKLNDLGYDGSKKIGRKLVSRKIISSKPQLHKIAPYFRARNIHDLLIDFRCTSLSIRNLINSYGYPYHYAKIITEVGLIPIIDSKIINKFRNNFYILPGYVIEASPKSAVIKTYDSAIKVFFENNNKKNFQENTYLYPPSYYINKLYSDKLF